MASAITGISANALKALNDNASLPPRPGRPRLNNTEASLQTFYERVVLLETLQRRLGLIKRKPPSAPGKDAQSPSWRVFLDQLSWLCDREHGGKTTSAIAVESTPLGPKYWIATNFDPGRRGVSHLKMVLAQLARVPSSSTKAKRLLQNELLTASLSFSQDKLQEYRTLLSKAIHYAKKADLAKQDSQESQLLRVLEPLSAPLEPTEVCTLAFKLAKSDNVAAMLQKHRDKAPGESGSAWFNVCRYVGRLQSWVRAIKVLICFVTHNPSAVRDFQADYIDVPMNIKPPPADHKTNLDGVLMRLLPKERARAVQALKLLRNAPAASTLDIDSEYVKNYRSKIVKPRKHAELMLLEHFWDRRKRLRFFYDDMYVGASKPSCYCCDLFFRSHCSKIATRPTHENVWAAWALPLEMMEDETRLSWDGKITLKSMTEQIGRDVLDLIESDLPRRKRVQDSSTGIWTAPTLAVPAT